jgi:spore maturation protein CgeB
MLEQAIIAKHFPLQTVDENIEYQQFRQALVESIAYLLQHDIERLSQAMYRIDVAESAFREALYQDNAELLADLAIERVKQKIIFRQKYQDLASDSD